MSGLPAVPQSPQQAPPAAQPPAERRRMAAFEKAAEQFALPGDSLALGEVVVRTERVRAYADRLRDSHFQQPLGPLRHAPAALATPAERGRWVRRRHNDVIDRDRPRAEPS